mmetsp:Transcript_12917/g.36392  ORF Transcript_12917/g.36392 Transcript_12917/m.36392 type:complete len:227 (+) Transcript_12917:383-1063(+)
MGTRGYLQCLRRSRKPGTCHPVGRCRIQTQARNTAGEGGLHRSKQTQSHSRRVEIFDRASRVFVRFVQNGVEQPCNSANDFTIGDQGDGSAFLDFRGVGPCSSQRHETDIETTPRSGAGRTRNRRCRFGSRRLLGVESFGLEGSERRLQRQRFVFDRVLDLRGAWYGLSASAKGDCDNSCAENNRSRSWFSLSVQFDDAVADLCASTDTHCGGRFGVPVPRKDVRL